MKIWASRHHLTPPPPTLTDAPLFCACGCVGAPLVPVGSVARVDSAGWPACEICGARLNRCKGKLHNHEKGKVCTSCYKLYSCPSTCVTKQQRTKRPYDSLQATQKWKRKKQAQEAVTQILEQIGVPFEAIQPAPTPCPADVLHLSTSERDRVRTISGVHIPCERTIIKCKRKLPATHATETGTFAGGAYITDPVRFVSVLCAQSPFIAVGGIWAAVDAGLGVTLRTRIGLPAHLRVLDGLPPVPSLGYELHCSHPAPGAAVAQLAALIQSSLV